VAPNCPRVPFAPGAKGTPGDNVEGGLILNFTPIDEAVEEVAEKEKDEGEGFEDQKVIRPGAKIVQEAWMRGFCHQVTKIRTEGIINNDYDPGINIGRDKSSHDRHGLEIYIPCHHQKKSQKNIAAMNSEK